MLLMSRSAYEMARLNHCAAADHFATVITSFSPLGIYTPIDFEKWNRGIALSKTPKI